MTEDEAHRQAEALAQGMDVTVYVVRNADGEFLRRCTWYPTAAKSS